MVKTTGLSKENCGIPMTLEESRKIQIDMLDAIVMVCEEHKLRYYLSGGTLLGAIRHKGFIPWDDDIDINMPRADCERLMQLTGGFIGKYRLASPDRGEYMNCCRWFRVYDDRTVVENFRGNTTKKYPYYHPIFIDIFPIEGLPEGKVNCYLHWTKLLVLDKMQRSASLKHMIAGSIWAHLFHIVSAVPAKLVGYALWGKWFEKCAKSVSLDAAKYIGVVVITQYITHERVLKEDYLKPIEVWFEGKQYNAPSSYDKYLTQLYGDYMKMPPIEKQKSAHAFKMYWHKA